jgi:hypothetical protein
MCRFFFILLSLILLSCSNTEKRPASSQKRIVDFDTLPNGQRLLDNLDSGMMLYYKEVVGPDTLSNGNITCYGIDDSMQYLYLRHGDTLHLLNKEPRYVSAWSLGTLHEEFDSFFITRIDNGNSVPESYMVFNKLTGQNILGYRRYINDYRDLGDDLFLFYEDRERPDSVFLYNVISKKEESFPFEPSTNPSDIIYIYLDRVTKKSLRVSYYKAFSDEDEKTIIYKR